MRERIQIALLLLGACSTEEPPVPSAPLHSPGVVTVTEGHSTTFTLSLATLNSGASGGVITTGGFYPAVDVDATKVQVGAFALTPASPSMHVTVEAETNPAAANEQGSIIYLSPPSDSTPFHGDHLNVVDTDLLNFEASSWNVELSSSATTTFQLRLTQPPAADVDALLTFGTAPDVVTGSPQTLTFTPANYLTYQEVTITAPADFHQAEITIGDRVGIPSQLVVVQGDYVP